MMPIAFMEEGKKCRIRKVNGGGRAEKFMAGLGLNTGSEATIVQKTPSGLILDVKGSRIAIDSRAAAKVMVEGA